MPETQTHDAGATGPLAVLDHVALYVADVDRSAAFYVAAFGLHTVPLCPPGTRWVQLGPGVTLHLIGGRSGGLAMPRMVHLSLQTADLADTVAYLDAHGIAWSDYGGEPRRMQMRFDGVRQIYVQDPDGYWVEIGDRRGA